MQFVFIRLQPNVIDMLFTCVVCLLYGSQIFLFAIEFGIIWWLSGSLKLAVRFAYVNCLSFRTKETPMLLQIDVLFVNVIDLCLIL